MAFVSRRTSLVLAPCLLALACGGAVGTTQGSGPDGGGAGGGSGGSSAGGSGGAGASSGGSAGSKGGSGGSAGSSGGRAGSGGTAGTGGAPVTKQPLKHRSASAQCARPAGPLPPPPLPADASAPVPACTQDSDCLAGPNPRCVFGRIGGRCSYDACFDDSVCKAGTLCECGAPGGAGNACLSTSCRVDGDCPGSWCSPTFGTCGNYSGVIGYSCHTPADLCTDDADCAMGGYCMYEPIARHWVCSTSQCVG
jgi:hypothetical protein